MQNTILTTRGWIWLIAALLLAVVGILNLSQRAVHKLPPTDGVMWKLTDTGIFAEKISHDSAAARARILPGDRLVGISLDEKKFEEISSPSEVQIYLEEAGIGGRLTYLFQRPSYTFGNNFYYADLNKLESAPRWTPSLLAFAFVGLVYLFIGFFVLFKQGGSAPFVLHFAALCLAAFAFHILKPIGTFEDFDAAVAIIDDLAFIFFAPVFLHFCWIYPIRTHFAEKSWQTVLLYVPAILLSVVSVFSYIYGNLPISESALVSLNQWFERTSFFTVLYRLMFLHFVAALTIGAGVLIYRFIRNKQIIVRQRLKWAMAGSIAAVIPIIAYQIAKSALNLPTENWLTSLAILPLAFIPLTFGHSVVRYRLMDVDIVVRHAAVYALTTLSISTLIGAVAFGFVFFVLGNSVGLNIEGSLTEIVAKVVVAVIAMAAIVMLSAPLKEFLQERADRFFYGERYDMRRSLLDFGKTLSATTQLDLLLNALMSRLQQVLDVEKVAVFIEDEKTPGGFRLARSINLSEYYRIPTDFRSLVRTHSAQGSIVRADDFDLADSENALIRQELHYYVPCVVRGRMIGVVGLGRTRDGSLLSSEDLDILQTISGYIAVAIENSLLYEEQQKRNDELALLKEFNESIVESVNVALLAVDSEGCVTRCNSTAEQIFNLERDQIVGNKVEELFAEDFADTLANLLGKTRWHLSEVRHAYKVYAERRDGKSFILNTAVAPLRSPAGERTGAILVLEDVTSRVSLEEQLQQREKLSSIGMLAAGVAHEVNTPLTGVSSYTQMLLGMIPETDPKHALLLKVAKQTDRASNIVGNLLNFSRAGSSGDFFEINLNKVLEDTLQLLEVQLRKGHIEIVKNYDPLLSPIYGSGGKLQQVFTNLILNARDAIVTEQGRIEITTRQTADGATVEVSDNGVGIEPENLSKIYDPFFTTKEVGKGTGLGLAVSYGIIQEHSGDIKVESAPGEGTKFTLKFPLAIPQQQRKAAGE
ncbi:MAG TPA: ATP-binding protein [Pyrinomonadaceae bacterium]